MSSSEAHSQLYIEEDTRGNVALDCVINTNILSEERLETNT